MTELSRACAVGVFAQQDECARRMGILLGQESKEDKAASGPPAGSTYRDPTGRFSLQVPKDWAAFPEGDKGILGVQLRSGSNWINVLPDDPAASASEVVLRQDRRLVEVMHSDSKPPFSPIGLLQVFGNGLEVTYDSFTSSNANGDKSESYIGGVGDIGGKGNKFLLIETLIGGAQREKAGELFLSVAQSIRLGAQ
jgi:hypothetical protein